MSTVKSLREYAAHSARKIVYNQPGLDSAALRSAKFDLAAWKSSAVAWKSNAVAWKSSAAKFGSADLRSWKSNAVAWKSSAAAFGFAAWKSNAVAWKSSAAAFGFRLVTLKSLVNKKAFGLRSLQLGMLSLSLAFLGNCGGCGSSNGNGGSSSSGPNCIDKQILKDGSCEACPDPQYPNADRTACVTQCPDGEIKLEGKPTCETQVTCTGRQIFNPTDNSCFELSCDEGQIPDTTVTPAACIEETACRANEGKLISTDGRSCITESGCLGVSNQLVNERGDCEACSGDVPVRNVEKTACISEAACQGTSSGPNSLLGTDCITDETCQDMAGHVATADGVCMECTGENSIRNMEKTACMSAAACQDLSSNAFSVLNDAECITDAACVAEDGRVATSDGQCVECTGTNNVRDVDKTACTTESACHGGVSTNPNSILGDDCITDAACQNMDRHVATAGGVCMECTGQTPDLNPARTACGVDDDSDGIFNADDNCPNVANADQTNTDDDGLGNACDADDDNDGRADASDNCPIVANADQANADDDELGNACDADDDNDGVADADDAFPTDECASLDTDDDNMPDRLVDGCTTSSLTEDTTMTTTARLTPQT